MPCPEKLNSLHQLNLWSVSLSVFTFVLPLKDNNDDDNFAFGLSCPTKKRHFNNDYDDIFDAADDLVRSNN